MIARLIALSLLVVKYLVIKLLSYNRMIFSKITDYQKFINLAYTVNVAKKSNLYFFIESSLTQLDVKCTSCDPFLPSCWSWCAKFIVYLADEIIVGPHKISA